MSVALPAAEMAKFAGSVELQFHAPLVEGQYKLLEVSEEMLAQIQASSLDHPEGTLNCMVEFRGANTDEAALVTRDKTYAVRLVESSNTQLLVNTNPTIMFAATTDDSKEDLNPSPLKKQKLQNEAEPSETPDAEVRMPVRIIEGTVQHHYEVIEILPRLHVMRDLLLQRLFTENEEEQQEEAQADEEPQPTDEEEADIDMTRPAQPKLAPLYTLTDLRRMIQACDSQLMAGLRELAAFEDERGFWRILDPDYAAKVFDSLCTLFVEKQWNGITDIDSEQCQEGLQELYPKVVTAQVLRMHSLDIEPGKNPNLFTLDPVAVCRLHAMQLFAKQQPYPHLDFMIDWQARVPAGMRVDAAMLRGHALCEVSTQLEAIARANSGSVRPSEESFLQWRHFPVSSLSPLAKTRFAQLFDARTKWRLSEIEPYATGLCAPGQTLEQLLLKQTRPITHIENGAKVILYTRR